MSRRDLVIEASNKALRVRQSEGISIWDSICIYDLVQKYEVDVRFVDIPSLEGMYHKSSRPVILVSSLRPPGRQAFTCAHEFGHHVYNHGSRIDELLEENHPRSNTEEFLADRFASFLLMPKSAVSKAFSIRGWGDLDNCSPLDIFTIAGWLGVGYETLISHMETSLHLINKGTAENLFKITPKQIKASILGYESSNNFIVVDAFWTGRAIDIQVGDLVLLPTGTISEGNRVQLLKDDQFGVLYCGSQPGIGRFEQASINWSCFVRVSRKGFTGLCEYRHWEEIEDD